MQTQFKKSKWRSPISADAARYFARVVGPPVLAAVAAFSVVNVALHPDQTPADVQTKATQLWRDNGYEVTGFKSYDGGVVMKSVTTTLKKDSDGKAYEGTATCMRSCAVTRIAAV